MTALSLGGLSVTRRREVVAATFCPSGMWCELPAAVVSVAEPTRR